MAICFRLRGNLAESSGISSAERQLVLVAADEGDGIDVVLEPADDAKTLSDARKIVIRGRPFESPEAALDAGKRWRSWAEAGFAAGHSAKS